MKNVKEAVEIHIMALIEEVMVPAEEDFNIARVNVAESAGGAERGKSWNR